jgi:hypothetical protein
VRDLLLEQHWRADHRHGREQRGRIEAQAPSFATQLACLGVCRRDAHCVGIEAGHVGVAEIVGEITALWLAAAPQHSSTYRVAQPLAGAVDHLVGRVSVGADDLGHLGR